jgi:hypothetical protein
MNDSQTISHSLLAVVREIECKRPWYGPPSATARVSLYDKKAGEVFIEIPVTSIMEQLVQNSRYMVEISFRPMMDNEKFEQTKSIE